MEWAVNWKINRSADIAVNGGKLKPLLLLLFDTKYLTHD